VWAFGCVLFEMLTARRAFAGDTVSDVIAGIIRSDPPFDALPAATPPVVRRLLRRLFEKDQKKRLRDIGDARLDLDEALSGSGASELPPGTPSLRRWRGVAITSLAVAVVVPIVGSLVARRPSVSTAEAVSQALVSQLTNYDGTEAAGVLAPDGRSFAFVSSHGGTPDIWVRQIAGGEPVRLTNDAAGEADLAYSPNGESVYYTKIEGPARSIWKIGALGGQARKVLSNAQAPAPSPDGQHLAWFGSEAAASGFVFPLNVTTEDGGNKRVLVEKVAFVVAMAAPAWSADARSLAYSSGGLFAPRNLFIVNVDDGRSRQITHFTRSTEGVQTQAWLPDNRHIIVSYVSPYHLFVSDLGIVDVETGTLSRLTINIADSFNGPSVSANGSRIVVTGSRLVRELWRVPFGPDPEENGRAAVRLVDASQDPMWTYVTRDGRTLLFNNALIGSRNLWRMPLDGSAKPHQITAVPGETVMHSSLSPDQTYVAFVSSATGNSDIWVQHVDGSGLRQLTNDAEADSWPVWSPDGRWIMFSSLRDGLWETRRVPASGGPSEKVIDGFFRGDWISKPDNSGTWVVTSTVDGGLRLLDFERRSVVWQDRKPGNAMPMFSPDAQNVSLAQRESRDRDAIWVYDVATGKGRIAVRFPQPFQISFRSSWVDDGRAFVVNRQQTITHIVMLDRLGKMTQ
jgi:serine/threonine-protein kinase